MFAPIVIFACGNPSRGDDALGPMLLSRLATWLQREDLSSQFELIEDFQLQIEHALDLAGRHLALFIDAGHNTAAPYAFFEAAASDVPTHSTHAISPQNVLAVLPKVSDIPAPAAFILCICGLSFELGEDMSASAHQYADSAFDLLKHLCRNPDRNTWQKMAQKGGMQ